MRKIFVPVLVILMFAGLEGAEEITLDYAKQLLLKNNAEYLAAESSLKATEWEARAAFTALFPRGQIQGGLNYLDPKPFSAAQENYAISYGLSINQPLFMGGKLWTSYRMKKDAVEIAKIELNRKKLSLFNKLEGAYYDYLLSLELNEINKNSMEIAHRNLEIAETRLEFGLISRADFLRYQSELAAIEVSLIQAQNIVQLSYRKLQNLIKLDDFVVAGVNHQEYQADLEFLRSIGENKVEEILNNLIGHGINNNPIIRISTIGAGISRKSLNIARGNFLPTINFSASKNWNDNFSGRESFDSSTTYLLTASLPIFPLADNIANLQSRIHSTRRTEREHESLEDDIKLAIEALYYSLLTSAKLISSSELALEFAEITYENMEERFKDGLISTIDLISVEVMLRSAKLTAIQNRYEFLKNRSALFFQLNITEEYKFYDLLER